MILCKSAWVCDSRKNNLLRPELPFWKFRMSQGDYYNERMFLIFLFFWDKMFTKRLLVSSNTPKNLKIIRFRSIYRRGKFYFAHLVVSWLNHGFGQEHLSIRCMHIYTLKLVYKVGTVSKIYFYFYFFWRHGPSVQKTAFCIWSPVRDRSCDFSLAVVWFRPHTAVYPAPGKCDPG